MKTKSQFACFVLLLALSGCAGGDSDRKPVPVLQAPPPDVQPPPFVPAGAIYPGTLRGMLYNNVRSTSDEVLVWTTASNEFRVLGFDFEKYDHSDALMTGKLVYDNDVFTVTGLAYSGGGVTWSDGTTISEFTLSMSRSGSSSDDYVFSGTWGTVAGDSGDIGLIGYGIDWGGGSPARSSGAWSTHGYLEPTYPRVDLQIDRNGTFVGHDLQGCNYSGRFELPNGRDLFIGTQIYVSDCPLAGDFQGLALSDGWADAFHLSANDRTRAILMTFMRQ